MRVGEILAKGSRHAMSRFTRVTGGVIDYCQQGHGELIPDMDEREAAIIAAQTTEADRLLNKPPDAMLKTKPERLTNWTLAVLSDLLFDSAADLGSDQGLKRFGDLAKASRDPLVGETLDELKGANGAGLTSAMQALPAPAYLLSSSPGSLSPTLTRSSSSAPRSRRRIVPRASSVPKGTTVNATAARRGGASDAPDSQHEVFMNYDALKALFDGALNKALLLGFIPDRREEINLADMSRSYQAYLGSHSVQEAEPFHVSAKLSWVWDALQTARTRTTEEDVLVELLGRDEAAETETDRP